LNGAPVLSSRLFDKAIAQGDIDTVQAEINAGRGQLNQPRSRYGMLPLHVAAWHGQSLMVDFLIGHGAALEGRSEEGLTALLLACQQGHWHVGSRLLVLGAQGDACDNGGNQAIHAAAEREGGEQLWPSLASRGVNVEARNAHGWTALHVAAKYGQVAMVKCMANAGADLNARDQEGNTPLLLAARERRIGTLWALHTLGANELARNRMNEGIGDIVHPLLFEKLGREHEIYWWLRPLMPVQKAYQPELKTSEATPSVRLNRSGP
jgi:ankyrin repeat protein